MARFDKGKETHKEPERATVVSAPAEKTATGEVDEVFGELDTAVSLAAPVSEPEPPPPAPAPVATARESPKPTKAVTPGHTLCKVVNTDIFYRGNLIAEGTVAEFDDATVLNMPTVLVSVE